MCLGMLRLKAMSGTVQQGPRFVSMLVLGLASGSFVSCPVAGGREVF